MIAFAWPRVTGQFGCDAIVMKLGGLKESASGPDAEMLLAERAIIQLPKR